MFDQSGTRTFWHPPWGPLAQVPSSRAMAIIGTETNTTTMEHPVNHQNMEICIEDQTDLSSIVRRFVNVLIMLGFMSA